MNGRFVMAGALGEVDGELRPLIETPAFGGNQSVAEVARDLGLG